MLHRFLALLGFAAARIDEWLRPVMTRIGLHASGVWAVVLLLLVAAAVPAFGEASRVSPQEVRVPELESGLSALVTSVRVRGRVVTLRDDRTSQAGYAVTSVLLDGEGHALLLGSRRPIEDRRSVTGAPERVPGSGDVVRRLAPAGLLDGVRVAENVQVLVDDVPFPESTMNWLPVWLCVILCAGLLIGRRVGYPVFAAARRTPSVTPLRDGEWLPVRVHGELKRTGRVLTIAPEHARLGRSPQGRVELLLETDADGRRETFAIRRDMWSSVTRGTLSWARGSRPALQVRSFVLHGTIELGSGEARDRASAVLDEAPA